MTTIIAVFNSEGCVGRCDANCYEAKGPDCGCICGCINHGVGLAQAVENSVIVTEEGLAKFAEANGFDPEELTVEQTPSSKLARAVKIKELIGEEK